MFEKILDEVRLIEGIMRTADEVMQIVAVAEKLTLWRYAENLRLVVGLDCAARGRPQLVPAATAGPRPGRPKGSYAWSREDARIALRNLDYWRDNGGTIGGFCQRQGIARSSLDRWRKRISDEKAPNY